MGTRDGYVLLLLISTLIFLQLTLDPFIFGSLPAQVESDWIELRLRKNAVRIQGVVARTVDMWPRDGKQWFEAEYRVGGKTYRTYVSTSDKQLAQWYEVDARSSRHIGDAHYEPWAPVDIIYDRTDPSRNIVGEFTGSAPWGVGSVPFSLILYISELIAVLAAMLYIIFRLFVIHYVLQNGERVLVAPVAIVWSTYPRICVLRCKWDGEYFKTFKGSSTFRIEALMKENMLKYIPMYILRNRRSIYYINCDELKKIVGNRWNNRSAFEELQEPSQELLWPKEPWFLRFLYKEIIWADKK